MDLVAGRPGGYGLLEFRRRTRVLKAKVRVADKY
jgi:hypothetical protein